jgi:hypothetical protein
MSTISRVGSKYQERRLMFVVKKRPGLYSNINSCLIKQFRMFYHQSIIKTETQHVHDRVGYIA